MANAPRSSGTDSLDTFRNALSKNMVPAPSPPAGRDDSEVRDLVRDTLRHGKTVTLRALAEECAVPLPQLLRVLGLPPATSPEQTVVGRAESAPAKPPAKSPVRKGRAKS